MKRLLLLSVCLLAFTGCGDDDEVINDKLNSEAEFKANLELVRKCIESGGDPEYSTGIRGVVTTFYGCRPAND